MEALDLNQIKETLKSRSDINPNGCYLWKGATVDGYGRLTRNKKGLRIHRLSYIIHKEAIPQGLQVLHNCDTRNCWNPDHLFLGTDLDNKKDMIAKNRQYQGKQHHWHGTIGSKPNLGKFGENSGNHSLTDDAARQIHLLFKSGTDTLRKFAKKFHDHEKTVRDILIGRRYPHIYKEFHS
jgi:hypothetical protein